MSVLIAGEIEWKTAADFESEIIFQGEISQSSLKMHLQEYEQNIFVSDVKSLTCLHVSGSQTVHTECHS